MALSKKLNKFIKANSILESVVALSIITICLFMAMMIFSAVFSPKKSPKFYNAQNKVNTLFYETQIALDSLNNQAENCTVQEELVAPYLNKLTVKYVDSSQVEFQKSFYIVKDEK